MVITEEDFLGLIGSRTPRVCAARQAKEDGPEYESADAALALSEARQEAGAPPMRPTAA